MPIAMWRYKKTSSAYQQWTNYPQSPFTTVDKPYQVIYYSDTYSRYQIAFSTTRIYYWSAFGNAYGEGGTTLQLYKLVAGVWVFDRSISSGTPVSGDDFIEANHDIYNQDFLTAHFAKTTTASQDAGNATQLIRLG